MALYHYNFRNKLVLEYLQTKAAYAYNYSQ